jgi:hypothetical protein
MKHDFERLRRETVELLGQIERREMEEREAERVRAAVAEALEEHERKRPAPEPKRSEMSTVAKAAYIREHGGENYLKLPWR